MPDAATISAQIQVAQMNEQIGEAVAGRESGIRRATAGEIIKLDGLKSTGDFTHLMRAFAEIENQLAHSSRYFDQALLSELEPYPSCLVRIEKDALGWGWLPEQLRALGLAINHGEELTWLTQEWAEISDREDAAGDSTASPREKFGTASGHLSAIGDSLNASAWITKSRKTKTLTSSKSSSADLFALTREV